VGPPVLVLQSVTPAFAALGEGTTLTLAGSKFTGSMRVYFRATGAVGVPGAELTTRVLSSTRMEADLPAALLGRPGSFDVWIADSEVLERVSPPVMMEVRTPAPRITGFGRPQVAAGLQSEEIRVLGEGFYAKIPYSFPEIPGSAVRVNGQPRTTRFVSATELAVTLEEADLVEPGTLSITVVNVPPGGGTSPAAPLEVVMPAPVLVHLASEVAASTGSAVDLQANGSGFTRQSRVLWDGQELETRYLSSTRLSATIPGPRLTGRADAQISVRNPAPGGGQSAARAFKVRPAPAAVLTSLASVGVAAQEVVYSRSTGKLYVTVGGQDARYFNSVVEIDPATATVTRSNYMGKGLQALAITNDGRTLYVGLNGPREMRRVDIRTLAAGPAIPLGGVAEDMAVLPGLPASLAVSVAKNCCSPDHLGVGVWDDGVPRSALQHTGSNTIAAGDSAGILYGYTNESSGFEFQVMSVAPSGIQVLRNTAGVLSSWGLKITYANGRIYGSNGYVGDPSRLVRVGTFAPTGFSVHMTPDPERGRAYFIAEDPATTNGYAVEAYDLNTLRRLGTVPIGEISALLSEPRGRLIRWGPDGLAFATGGRVFIVRTSLAGET
jgi:hypothetical protein